MTTMIDKLTSINAVIRQTAKEVVNTKEVDPADLTFIKNTGLPLVETTITDTKYMDDILANDLNHLLNKINAMDPLGPIDYFNVVVALIDISCTIESVIEWIDCMEDEDQP